MDRRSESVTEISGVWYRIFEMAGFLKSVRIENFHGERTKHMDQKFYLSSPEMITSHYGEEYENYYNEMYKNR